MNAPTPPDALQPPVLPPVQPPPTPAGEGDLGELLGTPAATSLWRRPGLWIALAVLLLAVAGGAWWWMRRAALDAPRYTTVAARVGDLTLSVRANGTVQPTRTLSIGSELSGTVLEVKVDVNDRIRKGQVLVVLDTAKLRDQIQRSKAAIASARAGMAQAAATVEESKASLNRLQEVSRLSGGKVPALTELDIARATVARAVAADAAARAALDDAQAALSTDQINLSKASITAPSDGVVLTRTVDPGNAVAASLQAVTLFTVAEDLSRLRLWVYVDEADVGSVKVDQQATFTVSAYADRSFPARITRVGFGSTITDNVVTYLTYLDVANADLSLRPGMTATATIVATQRKGVLVVPNAALRYTPTTAVAGAKQGLASGIQLGPPKTESTRRGAADSASTAGARQVWVLPADAKGVPLAAAVPQAVAVVTGISDGHMTEIVSGDLRSGMQVITAQKIATSK